MRSRRLFATLQRLTGALGVKVSYFFDGTAQARVLHVRPSQRPAIRGAGLIIEGLGGHLADQQMEPFLITLMPSADMGAGQVVHPGHELVYCLAGSVRYEIDGAVHVVEAGDLLMFEADLPHRWDNPAEEEARLLLVLQAAAGALEPARRHFPGYPSVTYMG